MAHSPIIIFDIDGVILSSKGHYLLALKLMRDQRHRWNTELLKNFQPVDIIRLLEAGAKKRSITSAKTLYRNFMTLIPSRFRRWMFLARIGREVDEFDWKYNDFFPNTIKTLRYLQNQGIHIGFASNSDGERLKRWFQRKRIEDIAQFYVSRDDRKKFGVKPNPGPLLAVLLKIKKHYNIGKIDRTQVAFVGDLATDIIAGKQARIKTIAVLSGHSSKTELESYSPDFILENINQIPENLDRIFPSLKSPQN
jgi:phosphoglycolate phosphatase-like HAD superfamily hydrolase